MHSACLLLPERRCTARARLPAETRDFFVDLLGFEVAMDMDWVVTLASPTNPSAQVSIIGNDDPGGTGDIRRGGGRRCRPRPGVGAGPRDRVPAPGRGMGSSTVHAPRAERHDRQRLVAPFRLSPATGRLRPGGSRAFGSAGRSERERRDALAGHRSSKAIRRRTCYADFEPRVRSREP